MKENNKVIPQGKYIPAKRCGNLVFTAGMTPRNNGVLIMEGKIDNNEPLEKYIITVEQATENALKAIKNILSKDEVIVDILSLNVYVNSENNFKKHSKLADFASEYLFKELGEIGIASRTSVGVISLPGNAPVEIQIIAAIE
ncbi:RidA family protein [Fusobacterium nucleatum subsp. nucleatum ATCC 25586]|uniref:RidA family protein n=1 Tax=Fusobacterium nucleatum subsp. nucleatum (strain ATCC 25586 / DSM 15643 / BCRC 10681 / CIP 101130 / JCM 8532 / KCTC 2640 / LMG 13131 / VPI 4355) TaxID=190304 RepID=Q8RFT1_FUSNN|nr:RidA family protein [Fusobacterium nucleatum]AAL94802.1 Translation initiation inhibitor [Fusobacterium nucleatum subsp. nucleatum ATCC 25586]AVQ15025.1 RidA family protein [Fusobacterium nucleatum subsp. nucleatum ATCC 25586]WMS29905.1 RidA family protein [Fusobacterium nucleatum]